VSFAEPGRELEQHVGDPAGDVDEQQVDDGAVDAAQPAAQHLQQAGRDVRS